MAETLQATDKRGHESSNETWAIIGYFPQNCYIIEYGVQGHIEVVELCVRKLKTTEFHPKQYPETVEQQHSIDHVAEISNPPFPVERLSGPADPLHPSAFSSPAHLDAGFPSAGRVSESSVSDRHLPLRGAVTWNVNTREVPTVTSGKCARNLGGRLHTLEASGSQSVTSERRQGSLCLHPPMQLNSHTNPRKLSRHNRIRSIKLLTLLK